MSDKCLQCTVRGVCCYVNVPIEGFNIILENVHCPKLDHTGLCTCYENRHIHSWCLDDKEMFNKNCLPRECEYLKEGNQEFHPKMRLGEILNNHSISEKKKAKIRMEYDYFDKFPFDAYIQVLHKKEVKA